MDYKEAGSDEWIGFDADMAKAFAESLGVTVEFQEITWDYKVQELDSKTIDCVWNGMTITDEVTAAMGVSNALLHQLSDPGLPRRQGCGLRGPDLSGGAEHRRGVRLRR